MNEPLPKGVYRQRKQLASGGETTYYRYRATGARISGEPGTAEFETSLQKARLAHSKPQTIYMRQIAEWVAIVARSTGHRARARGLECDLTTDYLQALMFAQESRCALTGLQFDFSTRGAGERGPYQPSIDRVESSRGYVVGNVRFICLAINLALNIWGEKVFLKIAGAALVTAAKNGFPDRIAEKFSNSPGTEVISI